AFMIQTISAAKQKTDSATYVIVTPIRDEAPYIGRTIASVLSQTTLPSRWIVVDDGSTDGTSEILDHAALRTEWITVVYRSNRGYRAAGSGVVDAFYAGYAAVDHDDWDFIVKLDGDLSFDADYFEKSFTMFE